MMIGSLQHTFNCPLICLKRQIMLQILDVFTKYYSICTNPNVKARRCDETFRLETEVEGISSCVDQQTRLDLINRCTPDFVNIDNVDPLQFKVKFETRK